MTAAGSPSFFTGPIILGKKRCKKVIWFSLQSQHSLIQLSGLGQLLEPAAKMVPFGEDGTRPVSPPPAPGVPGGPGAFSSPRHGKPPRRHPQCLAPSPPSRTRSNPAPALDIVPGRSAGARRGKLEHAAFLPAGAERARAG